MNAAGNVEFCTGTAEAFVKAIEGTGGDGDFVEGNTLSTMEIFDEAQYVFYFMLFIEAGADGHIVGHIVRGLGLATPEDMLGQVGTLAAGGGSFAGDGDAVEGVLDLFHRTGWQGEAILSVRGTVVVDAQDQGL